MAVSLLSKGKGLTPLIELGGGFAGGILLNDIVEKAQGGGAAGWNLTLFKLPPVTPGGTEVGVGLDDVLQAVAGLAIMTVSPSAGLGVIGATVAVKASEMFGTPIHFIKAGYDGALPQNNKGMSDIVLNQDAINSSMAGQQFDVASDNMDKLSNTIGYFSGMGGLNQVPSFSRSMAGIKMSI